MSTAVMTERERLAAVWPRMQCCGATNLHCERFERSWLPDVCEGCGHSRGCHARPTRSRTT